MKGILPLLAFGAIVIALIVVLSPSHTYVAASGNYVQLAREDAQQAGINPDIFVRQINEESGFNPNARGVSGEIGIAQFMPETAQGLGINPYDPVQSLQGAAQLMGRYVHRYGSEALALAVYNAGSGTVNRCLLHARNWYRCLPGVTQRYITVILQW